MFVVEIGSVLTTLIFVRDLLHRSSAGAPLWFTGAVTVWLWFTVIFANFAEAVAEGRGKAQADTLRKMRKETMARRLVGGDATAARSTSRRRRCARATSSSPRWASSSRATARSSTASRRSTSRPSRASRRPSSARAAAIARPSRAARRCSRTASSCASPSIPGESFLDRMIGLVEGASRQKTPNEIALHILLVGLTLVFLFACVTLVPLAAYSSDRRCRRR